LTLLSSVADGQLAATLIKDIEARGPFQSPALSRLSVTLVAESTVAASVAAHANYHSSDPEPSHNTYKHYTAPFQLVKSILA